MTPAEHVVHHTPNGATKESGISSVAGLASLRAGARLQGLLYPSIHTGESVTDISPNEEKNMGAHSAATLDTARKRVELVRDALARRPESDTVAHKWADALGMALDEDRRSTIGRLRAWMEHNHDWPVDTLQVNIDCGKTDSIASFWTPGTRRVDASRATRAVLNGSSRDYAGVITFYADDDLYVGFASLSTPNRVQMLVYIR